MRQLLPQGVPPPVVAPGKRVHAPAAATGRTSACSCAREACSCASCCHRAAARAGGGGGGSVPRSVCESSSISPSSHAVSCVSVRNSAPKIPRGYLRVNSRTHVPSRLTGLISLCSNPVSILSVPIQTVPEKSR
jgi:hypothetical protein